MVRDSHPSEGKKKFSTHICPKAKGQVAGNPTRKSATGLQRMQIGGKGGGGQDRDMKKGWCQHLAAPPPPFIYPRLSSQDFKCDLKFKKFKKSAHGPGLQQASVMKKLLRGETFLNAEIR